MLSLFRFALVLLVLLAAAICSPQAQAGGVIDAGKFPLVGDGKTDNQDFLELIFKLATDSGGATILMPVGNFAHSGRLTMPGNSELDGPESAGQLSFLTGTTPNAQTLTLNGDHIQIKRMTIQGVPGSDAGIAVSSANDIHFLKTFIRGFTNCIKAMSCKNLRMEGTFMYGSNNGIIMNCPQTSDIQLMFCGFSRSAGTPSIGLQVSGGDRVTLTGLVADHVGTLFNLSGTDHVAIDGGFYDSCTTAIVANKPNLMVTKNNFASCNTVLDVSGSALTNFEFTGNSSTNSNTIIIGLFNSTHSQILQNTIQGAGNVYLGNGNKQLHFDGNSVNGASIAVFSNNDTDITISKNNLQNCATGIQLSRENRCNVDANVLSTSSGISVDTSTDVSVTANDLTNMQQQGVFLQNNGGKVLIKGNKMTNCGLSPSVNPAAVIYANCPSASAFDIVLNSYFGSTANLKYFIFTPQSTASVFADYTNTMLPSHVGP
jgi:hypothetical protein